MTAWVEMRELLSANDRYWRSWLILRISSTVLCLAGIIAFGRALHLHALRPKDYDTYSDDFRGSMDIWPLMLISWAMIWNVFNALYIYGKKRSIHPGWNVGVELLTGSGLLITNTFLLTFSNPFTKHRGWEYMPPVNSEKAGSIFTWLIFFLHCYLFVLACCETDHRRRQASRERMRMEMELVAIKGAKSQAVVVCHECHAKLFKQGDAYITEVRGPSSEQLPAYPPPTRTTSCTEHRPSTEQV